MDTCAALLSRIGGRRLALVAVGVLCLFAAAAAFATIDHWFSGGLPAAEGYASPEGHSITYILGDANHNNFCIGREQGWGGWYYVDGSTGHYVNDACSVSGGHAEIYYNGACCYHATIENHNYSLNMTIYTSTHFDY